MTSLADCLVQSVEIVAFSLLSVKHSSVWCSCSDRTLFMTITDVQLLIISCSAAAGLILCIIILIIVLCKCEDMLCFGFVFFVFVFFSFSLYLSGFFCLTRCLFDFVGRKRDENGSIVFRNKVYENFSLAMTRQNTQSDDKPQPEECIYEN